jgi:hypothetical protein
MTLVRAIVCATGFASAFEVGDDRASPMPCAYGRDSVVAH